MNNLFDNKLNPDMLVLARQSKGLKQHELADLINVSQGLISKAEKGLTEPSEEIINRISTFLNYPSTFFYDNCDIHNSFYLYRKYSTIPKSLLEVIVANLKIHLIHFQKLLNKLEIDKDEIAHYDVDKFSPSEIAYMIRENYNIPPGPIKSVTNFVERFGIIVFDVNFKTNMFSGLTVPLGVDNFIIFINENMPDDRWRFTLAHEFGHIIMHGDKGFFRDEFDNEANLFASAFLMPEFDIQDDFINLDINKLALLKMYWNVSMSSILIRAHQMNKITNNHYVKMYKLMSKLGYKSNEPVEISVPEEKPILFKEIIEELKLELSFNIKDFCKLLNCNEDYFYRVYLKEEPNMKLLV